MSTGKECELTKILEIHLMKLQTEEAVAALKNEKYRAMVESKSCELIPIISNYLNEDTPPTPPQLVQCCSELLMLIAQYANPEEVIFEFIDQADNPANDTLFIAILQPLITAHMRQSRRRCDSLKWLLNAMLRHIEDVRAPPMSGLEGSDERKLLYSHPDYIRVCLIYSSISGSLAPLIDEICKGSSNDPTSFKEMVSVLQIFLLRLIGGPISLLDLSYDDRPMSEARSNAEKVMHLYALISDDMMYHLNHVDDLQWISTKKGSQFWEILGDSDIFTLNEVPEACFAVFYYLLFAEKVEIDKIPNVYSHLYVFQCGVYLSTVLFNLNSDPLLLKGLYLAKSVIEMQVDSSVASEVLDSPIHSTFQKAVIDTMIYNSSRECRMLGVKVLEMYINAFDDKGKYLVLMSMLSSAGHSGLSGFLLVQLKNIISNVTLNGSGDQSVHKPSAYFSGQNLLALLLSRGGCYLQHGAETDILEASDQVLSALNLLRFLALGDKTNASGFWDNLYVIREKFLCPLREGIDLSRAHYQVKRKDLEEQKRFGRRCFEREINVHLGGRTLPNLPIDEKILVVQSALNTFDLIESVLGRLNECLLLFLTKK